MSTTGKHSTKHKVIPIAHQILLLNKRPMLRHAYSFSAHIHTCGDQIENSFLIYNNMVASVEG